jgi:hypothetical protein
VFYDKNSVGGSSPEMDLRSLVQAALEAGKSVKLTVVEISGDGGNAPAYPEDLTPCQEHCIEVLQEAGHRLTQSQILASLAKRGYHDGESTVKLALAQMSRDGRLTKDPDGNPRGYGLPEWNGCPNNRLGGK